MATRLSAATRNASCDAIVDRVDAGPAAGTIDVRTGAQPATPDDVPTGTLLLTFTLADPGFGTAGAVTTGVASIAGAPRTTVGLAAGTAGWFRAKDSTGAAAFDGSVTATGGGGQLELDSTTISVDLTVNITGGTMTVPVG